jgi:hypothetical protein
VIETQLFDDFLLNQRLRAADEEATYSPLTGGVSSDIYRVDLPGRSICIKRALPKLKVAQCWEAPVSRSAFEWEWIRFASGVAPQSAPTPLAHDLESGLFAMGFLDPSQYPVWKARLLGGHVDAETAGAVGRLTGRIHAASTRQADLPERFASDGNFHALRLQPYLVATARKHPDVAQQLLALVERTAKTKLALVHGDVSPKNILVGSDGPILLDAECAWFGDPAFDLAFCLNHLLLKGFVLPDMCGALRASFDRLSDAYLAEVSWESRDELEARASALLPALLLARIDGKSPVEYVVREDQRQAARAFALPLISKQTARLRHIADAWFARFPH